MVVGLAGVLALSLRLSGFVGTDFISFHEAQSHGLTFSYLVRPVFDHVVPGHRFVNWVLQATAPLNFRVAIALMLVLFVASVVVMHRLLSELFRPGPGILVLTLFYAASSIQLGTAQWWAAGLSRLPATVLGLMSILLNLRYRRARRTALLAGSVALLGAALLFSEEASLVLLTLVTLRVLVRRPDEPLFVSIRGALAEWRLWLPYLLPIGVSVLGSTLASNASVTLAPGALARYLGVGWLQAFSPAVVGQYVNYGDLSAGELAMVVVAQAVLILVVAASLKWRPGAWRAWLFFAIGYLATQVPVGLLRAGAAFPAALVAHKYRYYSGPLVLLTIAMGAAFLGVRGDARDTPRRERLAPANRLTRRAPVAVIGLLLLAYLGGSVWSDHRVANDFEGRRAGPYLQTLKADLLAARASSPSVTLLDSEVPPAVILPVFAPSNRVQTIVSSLDPKLRFGTAGPDLYRVTADGHLEAITFSPYAGGAALALARGQQLGVKPLASLTVDADYICLRSTDSALLSYQLPTPVGPGDWYLRLGYRVPQLNEIGILVDRGSGFVPAAEAGLPMLPEQHEGVARLGDEGVSRLLLVVPPHFQVCLDDLTVALVEPRP